MSDNWPRHEDEHWLRLKYHDEGLTQQEMADEADVSRKTIRKYMDKHGVETRGRGRGEEGPAISGVNIPDSDDEEHDKWRDKDWLYEKYWGELKSTHEIADSVDGVTNRQIHHRMVDLGIPRRGRVESIMLGRDRITISDVLESRTINQPDVNTDTGFDLNWSDTQPD